MESYLKFFELEKPPFDAEGSRGVVLGTKALRKAFEQIKHGLEQGAPRICVGGSQGLGKTSLCRALPKLLADSARLVQIMNPHRPWHEIRTIVVRKLALEGEALSRASLLAARGEQPYLVIAIDQAELLGREALDHFDTLMRYRDDQDRQLVHCVLFANLEAAPAGADVPLLWWLDQINTLQLRFAPIPAQGIHHYIEKRLQKAGWSGGDLFSPQACLAIHRFTGGVPGAVNDVCERALSEASARGLAAIGSELIDELCDESIADALPPFDDSAFEDTSPSMTFGEGGPSDDGTESGMREEVGVSAQSLLDSTPLVGTARQKAPAAAGERAPSKPAPRPEPERLELSNDPFVGRNRSDAGPTLELSNDPFVTPGTSEPRSSLELEDEAELGRADAPGRGSVAASTVRTRRRVPTPGRARGSRKPAGRSHTRLLLLLLFAVLAGASFPQLRDQSALLDRFLPEPVRVIARPAKPPSEPAKANAAKPGSVADMLDAIDEAPATLPDEVPGLPVTGTDELADDASALEDHGASGEAGELDGHAILDGPAARAAQGAEALQASGTASRAPAPASTTPRTATPEGAQETIGSAGANPYVGPDPATLRRQQSPPPASLSDPAQSVAPTRQGTPSQPPAPVHKAAPKKQATPARTTATTQQSAPAPATTVTRQSAPARTTARTPQSAPQQQTTPVPTNTPVRTTAPAQDASAARTSSTGPGTSPPPAAPAGTPVVPQGSAPSEPVVNEHLSLP